MHRENLHVRIALEKGGPPTEGFVTEVRYSQPERLKRALRWWAGLWGAACVSVILPLLHFVLVPSFLIAGPVVAWVFYNQRSQIEGGRGKCPGCGQELEVARSKDRWPIRDLCAKCLEPVRITRQVPLVG